MTFQSYPFLLLFLPGLLALTAVLRRHAPGGVKPALIVASLGFNAAWLPAGLPVFLASIAANRALSVALERVASPPLRRLVVAGGVTANLGLLAWFRYLPDWLAAFGVDPVLPLAHLAPLGVSFFTFTQIGYLLDRHAGIEPHRPLPDQVLFVCFFPAQTAGPVLTAREVMPAIATIDRPRPMAGDLAVGLSIFAIGLLKKVLLADPLQPLAATGVTAPSALGLWEAWQAALAYLLLLYLDFSGYSDMAVGAARLFGLRYPWNFASPYQARGIIDYWQRWHISLTRFFMASVHAPLTLAILRWRRARGWGVDRQAQGRVGGFVAMHLLPLTVTMTLAGLWHGANWTFLVFGLLHAGFLAVNHAWRLRRPVPRPGRLRHLAAVGLTCLCALLGSVVFHAPDLASAGSLLAGMAGAQGIGVLLSGRGALTGAALLLLLLFVWLLPNTRTIMEGSSRWSWRPIAPWAVASGIAAMVGLLSAGGTAEFLYARF